MNTPKIVFIVPYRDRETQKVDFELKMKHLLCNTDKDTYNILFIHQCDRRAFNRGALKNIGFLSVKNDYPETYKNITLCFNDIDTYPTTEGLISDYSTISGTVKHFYGYTFTLGGIVSINAFDFEKINGFPNYWAWGYEDNMLYNRAVEANLFIDRSVFYTIMDKRISQINSTPYRIVNKNEFGRYVSKNKEGIDSIFNLRYDINDDTGLVNVTYFDTNFLPSPNFNVEYDTRLTTPPFRVTSNRRRVTSMNFS
jgi:N-terminal domain of galactosyltransferase/N-terminal region of glycosyl transferase group 7